VPGASPESPADWPEIVGSVVYEAPDAFVFVDPLVPDELWPALEERVSAHGYPVRVLTTIGFHRRSRDEVVRRFDATTSRAKASLPDGVERVTIRRAGETMVWLPGHRALIPGDRLLGDDRGGLRMCSPGWLRYLKPGLSYDELREALRPLLDLPVEMVLVSHGEPVLQGGRAAIKRALS
jgi:glyoxylase-like metal-dependent hydrolase (beta-lactamase superfamily II)